MKKAGVAGRAVTLKLKTAEFRTVTRARRLHGATRSAEEMFRAAEPLLAREADGRAFRLIGIGAHDLVEPWRVVGGQPRDRIVFGRDRPAIEFEMTIDRRRAPGLSDRAPAGVFRENAGAHSSDAAPEVN